MRLGAHAGWQDDGVTTAAPDVDDRADLRTSVVLVSLVVVVHLVMAYFVSALTTTSSTCSSSCRASSWR